MASGCPVVATQVGGLPDVIENGETGYLVPAQQPAALAAAMLKLISNPQKAEQMGRAAQLSVKDKFSIGRLISETESLYQDLVANKGVSL